MTLLAAHTLIEERQLNILNSCLELDEVERLEYETNHAVAIFCSLSLTQIQYGNIVQDILSTVVVVKNAKDIQ